MWCGGLLAVSVVDRVCGCSWLTLGSRRHTERVIYSFYSFRYSFHLRTIDITYSSYSFYSFRILSLEGAGTVPIACPLPAQPRHVAGHCTQVALESTSHGTVGTGGMDENQTAREVSKTWTAGR